MAPISVDGRQFRYIRSYSAQSADVLTHLFDWQSIAEEWGGGKARTAHAGLRHRHDMVVTKDTCQRIWGAN